jgi:hypothetical protein
MTAVEEIQSLEIDLESAGMLLTPEEFDAITEYDENDRYELIHGVLVVKPSGFGRRDI